MWAPHPQANDWWEAYRSLFELVANVGSAHTSRPERTWYAVWEGYGWDTTTTMYAVGGPLDDEGRRARRDEQAKLRAEDTTRRSTVRAGLSDVPRFELPNRRYYLLLGRLAAVTAVREPGSERWQRPDLFWPDDRSWFVATDVDFWSLYIGGEADFIAELVDAVPTRAEPVTLAYSLEIED